MARTIIPIPSEEMELPGAATGTDSEEPEVYKKCRILYKEIVTFHPLNKVYKLSVLDFIILFFFGFSFIILVQSRGQDQILQILLTLKWFVPEFAG